MRREWLANTLLASLTSLALGLAVVGILLAILGYNPLRAYELLFSGAAENLSIAVDRMALYILTGLAFAIPALTGLFNIGGEGMAYLGALTALAVGYVLPNPLIALLVGGLVGALLGVLVAVLKLYRGVHEVVSTIMLNWILFYLSRYIVVAHLKDPRYPDVTRPLPPQACLPPVGGIHTGLVVAVLAALAAYAIVYHTKIGLYMRATGFDVEAAEYQAINIRLASLASMALGGFFGGLAGAVLIVCELHKLDVALSSLYGVGFNGIGVALLAWNHPLGAIATAALVSSLFAGGYNLQLYLDLDVHLVTGIVGVIVFSLGLPSLYTLIQRKLVLREAIQP